jgi:hypothetical protein
LRETETTRKEREAIIQDRYVEKGHFDVEARGRGATSVLEKK